MGSLNPDSETKQEFDDSGYVQEDNKDPIQQSTDSYRGVTELLDLSDDVLLYILRHCSPMDLKALGFTCNRLAALILDRTLWQRVDARDRPCGPRRVRWFMAHGIGYNTTSIMFSGYARDTTGSTGQTANKDKIDVGASGDGNSVNQASTSQASTSQASSSQASTSQASRPQFSVTNASHTNALAEAIISQLKKSKVSLNQASNSNSQDNSPSYHIIEASPRNNYPNAPVESGQIHIIEANPLQGNFTSRVHIIKAVQPGTSQDGSNNQEINNQAVTSKMEVENQVSASHASKIYSENQVSGSQMSQMEEDSNGTDESKKDADKFSACQSSKTIAENQVSASQASKTDTENQVSASHSTKTDKEDQVSASQSSKTDTENHVSASLTPKTVTENQVSSSQVSKTDAEIQFSTSQLSKMDAEDQVSTSQACKTGEVSSSKEDTSVQASTSKVSASEASASASQAPASVSAEQGSKAPANHGANGVVPPRRPSDPEEERVLPPRLYRLTSQSMPRYGNQIPYWPESLLRSDHPTAPSPKLTRAGPRVTMTSQALGHLCGLCPKLEELALEYCVIDCATVNLSMFPNNLKKLSFRGSKCYNMEKSFLFKIQDYLSELEVLDLSYCEWVEPACLLPLSKLQNLHTLYMRECPKLSEFVAYASLATRYGFKALKVLDLRGSPVGDSEVSALGWLPRLEQLLLARAEPHRTSPHAPTHVAELEPWEEDEPEFFRTKRQNHPWLYDEPYYKPKTSKTEPPKTGDECMILGRMVAEPVGPDEYSSVYQRFFPLPNLAKPSNISPKPGTSSPKAGTSSPEAGTSSPKAGTSSPRPLGTPDEYRNAYSSFPTKNPEPFIISNDSTYSIFHNEDENGNDPNGQVIKIIQCGPSRSNDDEIASRSNDDVKSGPSKICDENGDEGPTPAKKMKIDDTPGPSKSSESTITSSIKTNNDDEDDDQSDSDDDGPKMKRSCQKAPDNAPTSLKNQENPEKNDSQPTSSTCQNPEATSNESKTQRYVRFRQYQPPVVVEEVRNNDNTNNNDDQNNNDDTNDSREPKHRILFVNVGRRRHAMYQLSMPVCTVAEPVDLRTNNVVPASRNVTSLIYASPVSSRLDHGALVTDSAIRRFGRADGENISYVHIGPNGPIPAPYDDPNARPNRSNLRVLSATGFRNITNTSLVHLATAAPHLRFIDFTGTSVTRAGVERFKSLRPDCKVRFSVYEKIDKPT